MENKRSTTSKDIISKMPDDILQHILSFLPTSFTVTTSTLSTRWKYLWISVPILEFDGQSRLLSNFFDFGTPNDFMQFVDKVLHANNTAKLNKFKFSCCDHYTFPFDKWMEMLMYRNVQELILELTMGGPNPLVLPSCFFNSESLTTLKVWVKNEIEIPSLISFPSLRVMHFRDVTFLLRGITSKVSFMCPVLYESVFCGITWREFDRIKIISPQLKRLSIDDSFRDGPYYLGKGVIEVSAESLLSLELITPNPEQYTLKNLSSLVDASIELFEFKETNHYVKLLTGLSTVKDLTLHYGSIQIFSHPDLLAYLHAMSSLKHLTIGSRWSLPKDTTRKRLIGLLSSMPKIESLSFSQVSTGEIDRHSFSSITACC